MAAAQLDRETQSSLCAEFLNFSAKDTAAVSGRPAAGSLRSSPGLSPRRGSASRPPHSDSTSACFSAAPSDRS